MEIEFPIPFGKYLWRLKLTRDCGNQLPRGLAQIQGVPIGCRSPRNGGLYCMPVRTRAWAPASTRIGGGGSTPNPLLGSYTVSGEAEARPARLHRELSGGLLIRPGRRGPAAEKRLLEARDTRGMLLRIVDRPAFLFHTAGTVAAVRAHHRLIPLAVAYILPHRPRARTVARVGLRTIGYHLGPARVHLGASGWHGRDRRQEYGREGQTRNKLVLCCHVSCLSQSKVSDFSQHFGWYI